MIHRRFGRTELQMPVISCGGMRYQHSWKDEEADGITEEGQRNLNECILRAVERGVNHIETARGYGTSEMQLGRVLPTLPREKIIVQTKVGPSEDPKKFLETFDQSLSLLQLDYVDLLGVHGINTEERLEQTVRKGGCLDAALELKKQGRVRHVGFSTHATTPVIVEAIRDGRFDYVNLHFYYVFQAHRAAVEEAVRQDMGVFIISPNDKGGKLYEPSEKLADLCRPLHPMAFNDIWTLSQPGVHTLSCGAARPEDFDVHMDAVALLEDADAAQAAIAPVEARLDAALQAAFGREWLDGWHRGLPRWQDTPGEVNIYEILRLRNFARGLDMVEYGKMRYNLLGNGDHWFPGNQAGDVAGLDLADCLKDAPCAADIPAALADAHERLKADDVKRLSES